MPRAGTEQSPHSETYEGQPGQHPGSGTWSGQRGGHLTRDVVLGPDHTGNALQPRGQSRA